MKTKTIILILLILLIIIIPSISHAQDSELDMPYTNEFDKAISNLFTTGILLFASSFIIYAFNKEAAKLVRMISYLFFASFIVTLIYILFNIITNLTNALTKLSEWRLFGG